MVDMLLSKDNIVNVYASVVGEWWLPRLEYE